MLFTNKREFCSHFSNSSPPPTANILNSVHILKFAQEEVPGHKLTYFVRCEQGKQHNKGPVFTKKGYLLRFLQRLKTLAAAFNKTFDLFVKVNVILVTSFSSLEHVVIYKMYIHIHF